MKTDAGHLPFESPEVRDIVESIRPEEKDRYVEWVKSYWIRFIWMTLAASTVAGVAYRSPLGRWSPWCGLLAFVAAEVLLLRWAFHDLDQLRRGILCSTEYAIQRGYRRKTLRLWRRPWSA